MDKSKGEVFVTHGSFVDINERPFGLESVIKKNPLTNYIQPRRIKVDVVPFEKIQFNEDKK